VPINRILLTGSLKKRTMAERVAEINRATKETDIRLRLDLDGRGEFSGESPVPFLNHMLAQVATHGRFDLLLAAKGDVEVDFHHTVEDIGICLGQAFMEAIGDGTGLSRYGSDTVPMEEALATVAIDFCRRPHLVYRVEPENPSESAFGADLAKQFFQAFSNHSQSTLHVVLHYGVNAHHSIEACFKAFARSLRAATRLDPEIDGVIPSTKGIL